MGKHHNPNLAKIHRSYSVDEIAQLYSVHKNTVRSWIKDGLCICDNQRPLLILGSDLREYIRAKRIKHKKKCKPHEMYCMHCKSPRYPIEGIVDYESMTQTTGRLTGLCSACEGIINKFISLSSLKQIQQQLDVTFMRPQKHIIKKDNLPLNSDFN